MMGGLRGESSRLLPEQQGHQAAISGDDESPAEERYRHILQRGLPPRYSLGLLCAALFGTALLHNMRSRPAGNMFLRPAFLPASFTKNADDLSFPHGLDRDPLEEESSRRRWKSDGSIRAVGGSGADEESEVQPPNVIFILIDDVGMNDFGVASSDLAMMTPFMQSLGFSGVRITKYYTNHICTPARASLMTGRDTFRTGMQFDEIQNEQPWGLPLNETTLAERFKARGYATHMVGKWNLGMYKEEYYPFNRGFDTFLGYLGPQETYYSHGWGGYNDFGYGDSDGYINSTSNTTRLGPELEGFYSTSLTADRALQVAAEHKASGTEDPLFMYLAFQAVHYPLNTPVESVFTADQLDVLSQVTSEASVRLEFAKILYFLDISIERMVQELDAMGMMDNTLLVLASDNGGCPSYGGSNYPYRGFKHTLFEGGVRAPALVYSKSEYIIPLEARGSSYDGMMHVTDWTQTLASITGIPLAEMGLPLSGFDHWSAIIGKTPASELPIRTELVLGRNSYVYDDDSDSMVKVHDARGAFIHDGWKISIGDKCRGWFSFDATENLFYDPECLDEDCATCTDACKYTNAVNNSYLFHLDTDPYEKVNLLESRPDKFSEMVQRWHEATTDEVESVYEANDWTAFVTWREYNYWIVAWK